MSEYVREMALSTTALFFRISPAGSEPRQRVERWMKIDDTTWNRKKYNAVPYTDTFYDVDDGTHKALIFNDDLINDEIMELNANDAPVRGDYVKFKDLKGPYGLMDVRGLQNWIRTSTDPHGEMQQQARHPATRDRIAPTDVQVITEVPSYTATGGRDLPEALSYIAYDDNYQFSVKIPEGVTQIRDWAFVRKFGLTSVTIPEGVTRIGDGAFAACKDLRSVTIPEGVTEIGNRAFESCSGLTSVTIPEGVTRIGDGAFDGCRKLRSVTIPRTVIEIGERAFPRRTKIIRE